MSEPITTDKQCLICNKYLVVGGEQGDDSILYHNGKYYCYGCFMNKKRGD